MAGLRWQGLHRLRLRLATRTARSEVAVLNLPPPGQKLTCLDNPSVFFNTRLAAVAFILTLSTSWRGRKPRGRLARAQCIPAWALLTGGSGKNSA